MIDETKLLEQLNTELDKAKARFNEEDCDFFYAAVCSALETTIKVVKRQPLFTPKQVLNALYGHFECEQSKKFIDTDSVQSKWILCRERLPECDGWYFATHVIDDIPFSGVLLFEHRKWFYIDEGIEAHPIAWQPFPEPFKE